ncbi:helix-turn-helix transcriptional regulator [Qipengyuania qiaonensis]|uniref:Helix-turn-helix transcriptional regulator n=1 Tax=Qipengyuania qiaonensis TaxID=2867240 RepID=A0ABS7JAX1_9SPHN|nr:helix-turn-helix transcriptional regulator [Qipengyuania qiaonensis]MBX7482157.1 helix-turn-helix transcriptional regulator [Qipengyuania qiaonensis]
MRYQDIYPSDPLLRGRDILRPRAADLLNLEYFEAEPAAMPKGRFEQHHLLLNYRETPHRVENWRDGRHRDFTYHPDEIVLTPAGIESGWHWHARSKVIVITLDPHRLGTFAEKELGILLAEKQLADVPQRRDAALCASAWQMKIALEERPLGFEIVYESLCRVFLVQLLDRYGEKRAVGADFSNGFTATQYGRVLNYVADNFGSTITVEQLARAAGLSPAHFSRLFKATVGETPHRFVMDYRLEQARKMLDDPSRALIDVALACGFADQAHLTRSFKQASGMTPREYRKR